MEQLKSKELKSVMKRLRIKSVGMKKEKGSNKELEFKCTQCNQSDPFVYWLSDREKVTAYGILNSLLSGGWGARHCNCSAKDQFILRKHYQNHSNLGWDMAHNEGVALVMATDQGYEDYLASQEMLWNFRSILSKPKRSTTKSIQLLRNGIRVNDIFLSINQLIVPYLWRNHSNIMELPSAKHSWTEEEMQSLMLLWINHNRNTRLYMILRQLPIPLDILICHLFPLCIQ